VTAGSDWSSEWGVEEEEAFSPSFRLTVSFLRRYPRYRRTLALTPEHYRFDRVLWNSSVATLRQLLHSVAESEDLAVQPEDVDEAVRNLVEGVVLRGMRWNG
jgi:hypothetical protein